MRAMRRIGVGLAATLVAAGCNIKGDNLPLEAAMYSEPTPVVEPRVRLEPEPARFGEMPVEIAGAHWQATATEYQLPARMLSPVGVADGVQFYALAWDAEPFDRLLVAAPEAPGRWREFVEVY